MAAEWGSGRQVRGQLLDHQLWCLGCDIRRPEGNLLLAFGFERRRAPAGANGGSAYRLTCDVEGVTVTCWGFGIGVEVDDRRLFLRRHPFSMELVGADVLRTVGWEVPPRMPVLALAEDVSARAALARACGVWRAYERWVESTVGASWRLRCWGERPRHVRRRLRFEAGALADGWCAVAASLDHG